MLRHALQMQVNNILINTGIFRVVTPVFQMPQDQGVNGWRIVFMKHDLEQTKRDDRDLVDEMVAAFDEAWQQRRGLHLLQRGET